MSLQLLENKALSRGIIGKSAPILAEITIRKSQKIFIPASLVFLAVILLMSKPLQAASSCQVVLDDPKGGAAILVQGREQPLLPGYKPPDCSQLVLARGVIH